MIDINLIREKPEWVKEQIARLGDEKAPLDDILVADQRRREIIQEVEELRRRRNESSKQIGLWIGSIKKLEADINRAAAAGSRRNPSKPSLTASSLMLIRRKKRRAYWAIKSRCWRMN